MSEEKIHEKRNRLEMEIHNKESILYEHYVCSELCFRIGGEPSNEDLTNMDYFYEIYKKLNDREFRCGIYRALSLTFPGKENIINDALKKVEELESDGDYSSNIDGLLNGLIGKLRS